MNKELALQRCMKLCSTKEYAVSEILQKLNDMEVTSEDSEWVISMLKEEKFLDDYRFARFYVNDKVKFNKWGRIKIKMMINQKNVDKEAVKEAISQIDENLYISVLQDELKKKLRTIKDTDGYIIRGKLYQFATGKGFEGELIHKMISEILDI